MKINKFHAISNTYPYKKNAKEKIFSLKPRSAKTKLKEQKSIREKTHS